MRTGRRPPMKTRKVEQLPPPGDVKDCTRIGEIPDPVYPDIKLEVRAENMDGYWRRALERGHKALQEDVL
jgi:hypothetical protein